MRLEEKGTDEEHVLHECLVRTRPDSVARSTYDWTLSSPVTMTRSRGWKKMTVKLWKQSLAVSYG